MDKRGSEQNPIRLKSADGARGLSEDDFVILPAKDVRLLQQREPYDPRPSNTHELLANDPEIPATQPDYRAIERAFDGEDAPRGVINGKRDISGSVVLSDAEKLVMLATNCLTPEMDRPRIAAAMRLTFNEVRSLRWHAQKEIGRHFKVVRTSVEDDGDRRALQEIRAAAEHPVELALDEETIVLQVKVLRILQGYVNGVAPQTNKPKVLPAKAKRWEPGAAVVEPSTSDYRELHRLYYGKDPSDDVAFQKMKYYLGRCVNLSDKQRLVVLSTMALTKPIALQGIARAMNVQKKDINRFRKEAIEIMDIAAPKHLMDERIKKARECRPSSLDS